MVNRDQFNSGSTLIYTVIVIFIFSMVMLAVLSYASVQVRLVKNTVAREQAFQIAEAGANYYQWRLAHFATDYYDGNATSTSPGPYIHDFIDKDTNKKIGEYSLQITPPSVGSTIVTIKSTGYTLQNPNTKRTITVRYGVPSLAKYAFLTNTDVWVGDTESINGEMHANGGIHFDGTGNALITSSKTTYTCQTYHGCSPSESTKVNSSCRILSLWKNPKNLSRDLPKVLFSRDSNSPWIFEGGWLKRAVKSTLGKKTLTQAWLAFKNSLMPCG
jgi:type II secretory pathway pseudopilin PulG